MISIITKAVKMMSIKRRIIKLTKEHKNLIDVDTITGNEMVQTLLKDKYIELGGKRFWEK